MLQRYPGCLKLGLWRQRAYENIGAYGQSDTPANLTSEALICLLRSGVSQDTQSRRMIWETRSGSQHSDTSICEVSGLVFDKHDVWKAED